MDAYQAFFASATSYQDWHSSCSPRAKRGFWPPDTRDGFCRIHGKIAGYARDFFGDILRPVLGTSRDAFDSFERRKPCLYKTLSNSAGALGLARKVLSNLGKFSHRKFIKFDPSVNGAG